MIGYRHDELPANAELCGSVEEIIQYHLSGEEIDPDAHSKPYSVRLYSYTVAALDEVASAIGVSRSYLMRRLLEAAVHEAQVVLANEASKRGQTKGENVQAEGKA